MTNTIEKHSATSRCRLVTGEDTAATFYTTFDSLVGPIQLVGTSTALSMLGQVSPTRPTLLVEEHWQRDDRPFASARAQLDAYFAGRLTCFELSLAPRGTAFQLAVWQALLDIPFGATASYLDIARSIGDPKACRAVGSANGRNPISIVVPCHRVIGSNGSLTGYALGIERKRQLLEFERSVVAAGTAASFDEHRAMESSSRSRGHDPCATDSRFVTPWALRENG